MQRSCIPLMTVLFSLLTNLCIAQVTGVAINTNGAAPAASSMLDIQSTTRGVLIPRMTSTQRAAIVSPATGLLVYDNTSSSFWYQRSGTWLEVSPWSTGTAADHVYNNGLLPIVIRNGGNIGFREGTVNVIHEGSVNTVENVLAIYRTTTGAAGTGIGASILFRNETPNNAHALGARISVVNEDASIARNVLHFTAYESGIGQPQLYVSRDGVGIGQTATDPSARLDVLGNIRVSGELRHVNTGSSNMMPTAYGVISANGSVFSETGNITASRSGTGQYLITVSGVVLGSSDVFSVTPVGPFSRMVSAFPNINGLQIFTYDQFGNLTDTQFGFVIYKL